LNNENKKATYQHMIDRSVILAPGVAGGTGDPSGHSLAIVESK